MKKAQLTVHTLYRTRAYKTLHILQGCFPGTSINVYMITKLLNLTVRIRYIVNC